MSKTYLFTGEESYLLHKELTKRQEGFEKKNGPDTVVRLSLWENDMREIIQTLCGSGLFSDTKLIIISGIPWETTSPKWTTELEEEIIKQRNNINPDYFIIFVSAKPDKRKKAFKFFSEHCEVKIFSPMDMRSLPKFIQEIFQSWLDEDKKHVTLDKEQIELIVELVGTDGRRLFNECSKLSIYINNGWVIDKDTLYLLISPSQESTAFELSDAIIEKNKSKIVESIQILSNNGEARQGIQWWLLWWLKQMIAYGMLCKQWKDPKSLWLAPFVAGKYNKYKDNLSNNIDSYKNLYTSLIQFDYQVKSWELSDEGYWLMIKEKLFENGFI